MLTIRSSTRGGSQGMYNTHANETAYSGFENPERTSPEIQNRICEAVYQKVLITFLFLVLAHAILHKQLKLKKP